MNIELIQQLWPILLPVATGIVLGVAWLIGHCLAEPGTNVEIVKVIKYQKRSKRRKKPKEPSKATVKRIAEVTDHAQQEILKAFVKNDSSCLDLDDIALSCRNADVTKIEVEAAIDILIDDGLILPPSSWGSGGAYYYLSDVAKKQLYEMRQEIRSSKQ